MPDYASQIAAVIGTAPADLVAYYEAGKFSEYAESRIHCMPFDEAKDYSQKARWVSTVVTLGLWMLNDANDSNPFTYISRGPCAGMILHLYHDDAPVIAFSSLAKFLTAFRDAGSRGIDIDDITLEPIKADLDAAIFAIAEEDSEDAEILIAMYMPIAAALTLQTKERLSNHLDFFVKEALANHLIRSPSVEDLAVAEKLANDSHPQVAPVGKKALSAVKRKRCEERA